MKKQIARSIFAALLLLIPAEQTYSQPLPELLSIETASSSDCAPAEIVYVEGMAVDSRIEAPLTAMLAAARSENLPVYLASGYRDSELLDYTYHRALLLGITQDDCIPPEYSDHADGLSVDLTDCYHEFKDGELAETPTLIWLTENCADYGFICRSEIAPWHFRYVGPSAREIADSGLTLEEYLRICSQPVAAAP